jgi:hypothetical protein
LLAHVRALAQGVGLPLYYPPTNRDQGFHPIHFTILSVTIEGDLAHAQVDYDYGLVENTFVKKDGNWYLVGEKIIKWHGG